MSRSTVTRIAGATIAAAGLVVLGLSTTQTVEPVTPSASAVVSSTTATPTPAVDPNNPWD